MWLGVEERSRETQIGYIMDYEQTLDQIEYLEDAASELNYQISELETSYPERTQDIAYEKSCLVKIENELSRLNVSLMTLEA